MTEQTGCAAGAPPHILTGILPFERLLFASDLVCLGTFRTAPRDAGFHGGHPCTGHLVVFPRRAVWIQHEGGRPFVADPATVPVYNRGQVYRRAAIDPRGDECEWMAFPSEVLLSALRELDHRTQDSPDTPFDIVAARGSGELYAAQRRLFAAASAPGPTPGAPEIEERALGVLDLVLRRYVAETRSPRRASRAAEAIEEARRLVYAEGPAPMPLPVLAARCGLSPFRLCREFRRATGMTITAYRTRLRLFNALEVLPCAADLSDLALSAGFCSHSHFGAAFRREFGITPSRLRGELIRRRN